MFLEPLEVSGQRLNHKRRRFLSDIRFFGELVQMVDPTKATTQNFALVESQISA